MSQTHVGANAVQTSSEVALQQIGDGSAQVSVKMGVGRPHGTVCVRYLYELASYMAPVKVKQSRGGATEAAGFGQWLQSHGEIVDQHEAGTGRSNTRQNKPLGPVQEGERVCATSSATRIIHRLEIPPPLRPRQHVFDAPDHRSPRFRCHDYRH